LIKRIIFGLGSNLGDRNFYLTQAIEQLTKQLFLNNIKKSDILKNPPLLLPDSPSEWNLEFFNIVISADIDLQKFLPLQILKLIKQIEKKLGRKNSPRWSPREIDIDILAIQDRKIAIGKKLIIPHYDLANRDFFLRLIAEIEPGWNFKL
jgi:2-amino-4-hydroxy-6-hydroxymethyldihydropteridine diphosphokinase